VVLLDEATAALDAENEAAVQEALTALAADRTVIVIAHRLQTVTAADQILVLDGGRIAERGSHADLLAAGGRYRDFWQQRTTAAGWQLVGDPTS
jgi:ATP-binding cassette subfamily B protein